nr:hypothetical protein [Streptomyces sp. WAC04770]
MFGRRRARREFLDAQQAGNAMLRTLDALPAPGTPGTPAPEVPDFLPADLRAPNRQDMAGLMMPYNQPLVLNGEIRSCPTCGAYRDWIIFAMRDDSVWLRCRAGHETPENGLDAAWVNRNSGPVDKVHSTLDEGLRHLGH